MAAGASVDTALRRSPLHDRHVAAGARMVPFAGFEMPVQYEGIRAEHLNVRAHAGVFDVSHMGEVEVTGPRAFDFLQAQLTNDLGKVPEWGAQYGLMCQADGGMLDDLITYRLPDRFLIVVNAAKAASDFAHLQDRAAEWDGVELADRSDDYAMLALQGPEALSILAGIWDGGDPGKLGRFVATEAAVAGQRCLVCRTGYTGEDGVELLLAPDGAVPLWDALLAAGARPAGLGARDTLRLEVCFPLYGNDLSVARTPIEAGLGWCCALDRDFLGVEAMRDQQENGTAEKLAPFVFTGPGIPRPACSVIHDGKAVGTVTSGTLSPSMEIGIGMAYVRADLAAPGTEVGIDVRGKLRPARIESKPLYKKTGA